MHKSFQTLDDVFKEYFPTLVPELSSDSDSGDSADEGPNNSDEGAEHDHILDYIRSSQEESTNVDLYNDDDIMVKIRQQKETGCGCQNKCLSMFDNVEIFEHILQMRELRKEEKDMYIMGKLKCKDISSDGNDTAAKRKRYSFYFDDCEVCTYRRILVPRTLPVPINFLYTANRQIKFIYLYLFSFLTYFCIHNGIRK